MTTPTPGTIPAMTEYQPGQLPLAGTEAFEIVNTMDPDTAATYALLVKDAVGKAAGVMSDANPLGTDRIVIFRGSTTQYFSALIGNLNVPAGNLPVAGNTGQFLYKNSGTDFDASWVNIASAVAGQTSIVTVTGATSLVIGIATAGIGSTQIGTNAVQAANFRQSAGLSVVGVAGTATANVADITATAGTQVLQSNAGGTGLIWTSILPILPGPLQVTTLPLGVVVGLGTAAMTVAPATMPGALVVDQGTTAAPVFRIIGGDLVMSLAGTATVTTGAITYAKMQNATGLSVLGVAGTSTGTIAAITAAAGTQVLQSNAGGTGLLFTTVIAALPGPLKVTTLPLGAVIGLGTSAMTVAPAISSGALLVDQGTASPAVFRVATGDLTVGAAGTFTIATGAVSYQKIQTAAGLSIIGNIGTASALMTAITGGTGTVLAVTPTGTTLGFSGRVGLATALLVGALGSAAAIATGNVAASSFLQSYGGFKITTASFSTATTVLSNIPALSAALATASTYNFKANIYATSGNSGGAQIGIDSTGTASVVVFQSWFYQGGTLSGAGRATALAATAAVITTTIPTIIIVGSIVTNNAGTMTVQIAQAASTTTSTVVLPGSTLEVFQVAP